MWSALSTHREAWESVSEGWAFLWASSSALQEWAGLSQDALEGLAGGSVGGAGHRQGAAWPEG